MLEKSFVKELRDLSRSSSLRHEHKLVLIEGFRAISGAIEAGAKIEEVYYSDENAFVDNPIDVDPEKYVHVSYKVITQISTTKNPQSVIALAQMPQSQVDCFNVGENKDKPIFILDNVGDPGNVGTIIRSALAFGFAGIVMIGGVDPYNTKIIRSSAGTIFGIDILIAEEYQLEEIIGDRKLYATKADGEVDLDDVVIENNAAFVLGNEAHGIKGDFFENNASTLRVNMEELCESLNVAMLATIVAHKMFSEKVKLKN